MSHGRTLYHYAPPVATAIETGAAIRLALVLLQALEQGKTEAFEVAAPNMANMNDKIDTYGRKVQKNAAPPILNGP